MGGPDEGRRGLSVSLSTKKCRIWAKIFAHRHGVGHSRNADGYLSQIPLQKRVTNKPSTRRRLGRGPVGGFFPSWRASYPQACRQENHPARHGCAGSGGDRLCRPTGGRSADAEPAGEAGSQRQECGAAIRRPGVAGVLPDPRRSPPVDHSAGREARASRSRPVDRGPRSLPPQDLRCIRPALPTVLCRAGVRPEVTSTSESCLNSLSNVHAAP